jgi:GH35 family endo-1,4-beta-xylanase
MLFRFKILWCVLGLVIALAISLLSNLNPPQTIVASPATDQLEVSIRRIRMGDLVIRVVDSRQQPIAGATVQVNQLAHHFPFGTALRTEMFQASANPAEQRWFLQQARQLFNASVHENALKWYATEPVRGQVSYADADRILAWSQQNGLTMRGHTLFWALEQWNQPWVRQLSDRDLRAAVEKRAREVCSRYRGRIGEYDVLNEMLHGDFFQKRLGERIVDDMFRWCREADPTARLYVNDFNILNGRELDRYIEQIRTLRQRGVPIGGIGAQGHIAEPITADQVQKSLDALAQFGLPIKITEFDAEAPNEAEQARILKDVYRVAFAHPAVAGILMWGFWEGAHWKPNAAMFKRNFQPTLSAKAYQDLVFRQWWTTVTDKTDPSGTLTTRGFYGRYQVTVRANNRTIQQTFSLLPQEASPRQVTIVFK